MTAPTFADLQNVLTVVLAVATLSYARVVAQQRADAFLPLLHWQSPHAAVSCDWKRYVARVQVHIVLWNIGAAARIRAADARSRDGTVWMLPGVAVPSIVPAKEQLIVQAFVDMPLTIDMEKDLYAANLPGDIELAIQFEDVVERMNYISRPRIRFSEMKLDPYGHRDVPLIPLPPTTHHPELMDGLALRIRPEDFDLDSRGPRERQVPRTANPWGRTIYVALLVAWVLLVLAIGIWLWQVQPSREWIVLALLTLLTTLVWMRRDWWRS